MEPVHIYPLMHSAEIFYSIFMYLAMPQVLRMHNDTEYHHLLPGIKNVERQTGEEFSGKRNYDWQNRDI
jgi:hypothetical protein